jgi:hypothetical protein
MYLLMACYHNSSFNDMLHANDILEPLAEYLRLNEEIQSIYAPSQIGVYQNPLDEVQR